MFGPMNGEKVSVREVDPTVPLIFEILVGHRDGLLSLRTTHDLGQHFLMTPRIRNAIDRRKVVCNRRLIKPEKATDLFLHALHGNNRAVSYDERAAVSFIVPRNDRMVNFVTQIPIDWVGRVTGIVSKIVIVPKELYRLKFGCNASDVEVIINLDVNFGFIHNQNIESTTDLIFSEAVCNG